MQPSMSTIRFLMARAVEVPMDALWLAREELAVLERFRFEKRRRDWLLGRWTAKRAVRAVLFPDAPLEQIAIHGRSDGGPQILFAGETIAIPLSLSHSGDRAIAALGIGPMRIGCDLERVEPRDPSFAETFFTASERSRISQISADMRDRFVTAVWSAKESALKALREGLRRDTREVEIDLPAYDRGAAWSPVTAQLAGAQAAFSGWTSFDEGFVLTFLSAPGAPIPTRIA